MGRGDAARLADEEDERGRKMKAYNKTVPMTRRYPDLPRKQLERDSKIAYRVAYAHDMELDNGKVLDLFRKYHRLLSNPRYWEMLKVVWIAVGSTSVAGEFRQYMQSTRACRNYFMTPEEHEVLRNMKFPLKVWRACSGDDDDGLSWTVNLEVAMEFAVRGKCRKIITREVVRKDVFAYINRRGEDEIIIL